MKIGIDIGGSHIGAGIVDENGNILSKIEEDVDRSAENLDNEIVKITERIVSKLLKLDYNISKIGVSSPGTIESGHIKNVVNLGIVDIDIKGILENEFKIESEVKNDAKCATIGEQKYGSIKGYKDALFLSLGTGIGGGVLVDGKLLEPSFKSGMEFGHMIIESNGRICKCGKKGCFETYSSMKILKKEFKDLYDIETDILTEDLIRIIEKRKDEKETNKLLTNYIKYLSIGISNLINIFEPEVVVLGGSIAYYGDIIVELTRKYIKEKNLLFNKRDDINIVLAKLKNDAGIIGAASM